MNAADAVLIVLLVSSAVSGYRRGLISMVTTMVAAIAGAIIALKIAPALTATVQQPAARIGIGIAVLLVLVLLGQAVGAWVGARLGSMLAFRPVQAVDRGLGLVGQVLAALVIAWLLALPLAAAPVPWLSSQIRGSAVLAEVNDVMPEAASRLSARLRTLFAGSGLPQVLAPLAPAPDTPTDPPDDTLVRDPDLIRAERSVLKIRAESPQCSRAMEGTGFVITPGRIVTNAHVVAGSSTVTVETPEGPQPARVVLYDAEIDIAVLAAPGVDAAPLPVDGDPVPRGTDSAAVGYPLDGPYTVAPMRIRARTMLRGPDIYSEHTVSREVYTLRGSVRPGNSGGPLLDDDGTVIGVIFGAAIDDPDVGFALTARQAMVPISRGLTATDPVTTGACT